MYLKVGLIINLIIRNKMIVLILDLLVELHL